MAQVITGLDNIPISAASAAYAPTNTADVTAMIDSAVSAKLDASASSSFQPAGNYVSSDDLSAYQTTAGMSAYATTGDLSSKLDVTSIADYMPLSYSAEFYPTGNPDGYLTSVDLTPYAESSSLTAYQQTAGMSAYLPTSSIQSDSAGITSIGGTAVGGKDYTSPSGTIIVSGSTLECTDSAYVGTLFTGYSGDLGHPTIGPSSQYGAYTFAPIPKTVATRLNLSLGYGASVIYVSSDSLGTIQINKGDEPLSTSEMLSGDTAVTVWATEWLSCSASYTADSSDTRRIVELAHETALSSYQPTAGMSAYLPTSAIGVDTASSLITGINGSALSAGSTYSAGQYVQISGDEISVTGLQPSGSYVSSTDLSAYQPTADMSAYATTGDLSAKLDASASSSFLTAQEQASWSETASASPSYIVDKPDLVDIVAGPGIVVDNPDGNTLRVSLREDYEEVLYAASTDAGTTLSVNGYITLSESLTHFEKVKIYYALQQSWGGCLSHEIFKVSGDQRIVLEQLWFREQSGYNNYWQTITFSKYNDTNLTITLVDGSQRPLLQNSWGSTGLTLTVFKVVGIHRIANN